MKKVIWIPLSSACLCFSCVTDVPKASLDDVYSEEISVLSKSSVSSEPTIEDFKEYYDDIFKSSIIYYWKNENGGYMCILETWSNYPPSFKRLQNLQVNKACPISLMAKMMEEKYREKQWGEPMNEVYEVTQAIDELEYYDIYSTYGCFPTRNAEIYSTLGLEATYERYYADSEQVYFNHDGLFENEANPVFRFAPRNFTNLSHIYRWTNGEGQVRFGIAPQNDGELCSYECLSAAQLEKGFDANEMRRLVEAYYSVTDVDVDNLIVDVPVVETPRHYYETVTQVFPDNISNDFSLYQELGLEESYRRHFGVK